MLTKVLRWPPAAFAKRLLDKSKEDDVSGSAAALAYHFFLALFPFLIFLAALGGFVASAISVEDPTNEIMDLLGESLPADATSVIRTQVDQVVNHRNAGLASIAVIGAIWAASGGISTVMKASNRAYAAPETRPAWKRYAISLSLTISAGVLLITAALLLILAQVYGRDIADEIGLESTARLGLTVGTRIAAVLLILLATSVLYWAAPSIKQPFRFVTPGAVLFTVLWLAGTFFFSLYVSNLGSYNATYGTLGGIVVMLVWFYLTGYLLLAGIEVNSMALVSAGERALDEATREAPFRDGSHPIGGNAVGSR